MDYLAILLTLSFACACILVLTTGLGSLKNGLAPLPPGPFSFPIIGNILQLGNLPHQAVANLSKTYGPLMTLKLGRITTIVISSPAIAKEALHRNDQALSSRTIPHTGQAANHHKFSLVWLPASAHWRNLRKVSAMQIFLTQRLDDTQDIRRKKVEELLDHIKESRSNGEAVDIGRAAFTAVLNSVSNTFFSIDMAQYSSKLSQHFQDLIWGIMEEAGRPNIADYFPALRLVDPQGAHRRMTVHVEILFGILDDIIYERKRLKDSSTESKASNNDVMDSLINITEEDNPELSLNDIKHLLLDLFVAGVDTTSSTVEWAMAELLHSPKKMTKAKKELEEVLGKDGIVQEMDMSKFPYLQAIVKETFRLHPPAPFLVPHKAETEVEMCGFVVPKNAQILVNVWAMGRDSSIWPNPNLFMPERFLERSIDFKGQDFELIPFGAGRRICPGLPLANRMVHLMLACLIHSFNWKLADEMKPEDVDMSEMFGITLHKSKPLQAIPI